MKLTKTFWITLGVVLILAGAVTLFMLYRGQVKEQDKLNSDLTSKNRTIQLLDIQRRSLEADLVTLQASITTAQGATGKLQAQITDKQAELKRFEDTRAKAVADAIALLKATGAKFLSSAESIEYNGTLFKFASDNKIEIHEMSTGEPSEQDVEGILYAMTAISLNVTGSVENTLNFIKTITGDPAFKTTVIQGFEMSVPEPLTTDQIEEMKASIRKDLMGKAMAGITTEQMIGFITDSLAEVIGPGYPEYDQKIETKTVAEMAAQIKSKIDEMVEAGYPDQLSNRLAEFIEQSIANSLVDAVIGPFAQEIADMIVSQGDKGPSQEDIEELVGPEIAKLLGENLAGSLSGDISGLLKGYVSALIQAKMTASVAPGVEAQIQPQTDAQIAAMEKPSSQISLVIYTYKVG
jgi:hypothetical protein